MSVEVGKPAPAGGLTVPGGLRGGRWLRVAQAAGLADAHGVRPTIFSQMTALAQRTGAVNLGQGFPDTDGPAWLLEGAVAAIRGGSNQYPPAGGEMELRRAIADHQHRHYGVDVDPATQVTVTTGATEALASTVLALTGPGDEVITLEPYYDAYAAHIAMAGATHVPVPLVPTPNGFRLDPAALEAAVTARTRLILINTPHNPTGTVLRADELAAIARTAIDHDLVVVTDEVYEHLTYGGVRHQSIAAFPGMAQRSVTISSLGKSYSLTGWKVGWAVGSEALITAVRAVQQFVTFGSGAPFQVAAAEALLRDDFPQELALSLAQRRDVLVQALRAAGMTPTVPDGTYFVVADGAPLGFPDAVELCRLLPELIGVVGIPVSAFTSDSPIARERFGSLVRFTFVKDADVVECGAQRLATLPAALGA